MIKYYNEFNKIDRSVEIFRDVVQTIAIVIGIFFLLTLCNIVN
jgi:hypothetical protein